MLFRVAVHLAMGILFAIFRTRNFGLKLLLSVGAPLMILFAYNDWQLLRANS